MLTTRRPPATCSSPEIEADPVALGFFTANDLLVREGHVQYVDDATTSPDGRHLYVSRPSLADVVALDLGTRQIAWRVKVDGYRSDHMASGCVPA